MQTMGVSPGHAFICKQAHTERERVGERNVNYAAIMTDYLCKLPPTDAPEAPKSCELRNDTVLEVVCLPGSDGGLSQYFMLEVVGGDLLYGSETPTGRGQTFGETIGQPDNEISTLNDQVSSNEHANDTGYWTLDTGQGMS